jgi:hypothetical protein
MSNFSTQHLCKISDYDDKLIKEPISQFFLKEDGGDCYSIKLLNPSVFDLIIDFSGEVRHIWFWNSKS